MRTISRQATSQATRSVAGIACHTQPMTPADGQPDDDQVDDQDQCRAPGGGARCPSRGHLAGSELVPRDQRRCDGLAVLDLVGGLDVVDLGSAVCVVPAEPTTSDAWLADTGSRRASTRTRSEKLSTDRLTRSISW